MITSSALEQFGRDYREARLADAAWARLLASIPQTRETRGNMFFVALRYSRYALTSLAAEWLPIAVPRYF